MRVFALPAIVLTLLPCSLLSQSTPERIAALEAEVKSLRAEIQELRTLKARAAVLERIVASMNGATSAAGSSRPGAPSLTGPAEPWPAMPYGASSSFLVVESRLASRSDSLRNEYHDVELRVLEVPESGIARIKTRGIQGHRYASLPFGAPASSHLFRLVIEGLGRSEAQYWQRELGAVAENDAGRQALHYRFISFERMPTSQSLRGGYDGNSGTVRPWRGKLYWYENNVFFREAGVLRLLGSAAARYHLRFVRHDDTASP